MKKNAAKLKILLGCIGVSILVVIIYSVFEYAVHHSITYIWDTLFNTDTKRYLVIPLTVIGALLFFGLQHLLDPKSENHEAHGIGGAAINPTLRNFAVILIIGFFSLVGGASLGPEAVLVPACTLIGAYVGVRLFKKNPLATKALAAAAIMALMTSFFHSFIIGILSVFIVVKVAQTKLTSQLVIIAVISSVSAYLFLSLFETKNRYFDFPDFSWKVAIIDLIVGIMLIAAGYVSTFVLKYCHNLFVIVHIKAKLKKWWVLALVAGVGLGGFYLLGGPLVEFTGNESIAPLINQAPELGITGVLVILVVKILAISWSKAMGYRGGLIFPMVFVASSLVAISQLLFSDVNFGIALIAALIGILAAERKAKILL